MALTLYIYYRADGNKLPIITTATELMADIKSKTGIDGRLLQRADKDDHAPQSTWMEVYDGITDRPAFCHALAQALALRPTLAALARHEEWFMPPVMP